MRLAFWIAFGYASLGFLYAPGIESLTALAFVLGSCAPLLFAGGDNGAGGAARFPKPGPLIYWGIVTLGMVNLGVITASVDRPVTDLLSLSGLVTVAALSTGRRYQLEASSGDPLLLALSLWLVFRVGTATDRVPRSKQVIAALPVALYTLVSTEKWPLYLAGVFFFAGILIAFPPRYAVRTALRYLAIFAPVGLLLGVAAMVLRGSDRTVAVVGDLLHYVLAPYPAFGSWLLHESQRACCTLGAQSFIGPLDWVGLGVREAGVFRENAFVYGRATNIYTGFRYLVQDFSILGPFLIASWLSAVHAGLRMLGSTALSRQLSAFAIFGALLSVNVTPFVHNSVALAMFLSLASTLRLAVRLPPPEARRSAASAGTVQMPGSHGLLGDPA